MGVVQSAQHRARDPHRLVHRDRRLARHALPKRLSPDVLHDERGSARIERDIPDLHDVRVIELGQGRGLIPELGQLVRLHELQRHPAAERRVLGLPHLAEGAPTAEAHQLVASQDRLPLLALRDASRHRVVLPFGETATPTRTARSLPSIPRRPGGFAPWTPTAVSGKAAKLQVVIKEPWRHETRRSCCSETRGRGSCEMRNGSCPR